MADYYTLLTTTGAAKLANAQATATTVNLAEIAVGDGDAGAAYEPTEDQAALKNEVWRGAVNQIYVHTENANWLVIEAVVPEAVGGWFVREVGVFDAEGDMIAIGKYPETYKPALAEGSAKDLFVRFISQISNTADVTLQIDPAIVLATRSYVDAMIAVHDADPAAHADAYATHNADTAAHIATPRTFTAPQRMATTDLGAQAGTVTPDFGTAEYFKLATGGDISIANPSNIVVGQQGRIIIDNTAAHSLTGMGTYWKRAGAEDVPEMAARGRIDYDVVAADRIEYVWLDVEA